MNRVNIIMGEKSVAVAVAKEIKMYVLVLLPIIRLTQVSDLQSKDARST